MNRLGLLLASCVLLGACTVVDGGVGRGASDWSPDLRANSYIDYGWMANETLLSMDLFGGPNAYTLVRLDVWRLLHLELGLLGFGLGVGPFHFGAGSGIYAPEAPAMISGDNPMNG